MRTIDTAYRVLTVLKLLNEGPKSLNDLCFSLQSENLTLSRETISKYFSTLRSAGCEISKVNGKFILKRMPFCIDMSAGDIETIALLGKYSDNLHQKITAQRTESFISKILQFMDEESVILYRSIFNKIKLKDVYFNYRDKINHLSKFFDENSQKIKIEYKENEFIIIPKGFKYGVKRVFLEAYNTHSSKCEEFLLDFITQIKPIPQISCMEKLAMETIFRLSGRLAKTYVPRSGEILSYKENSVIVTNKEEDKTKLLQRLVRYGDLCEILYPNSDKEKFVDMLNDMINNFQKAYNAII